MGQTVECIKPNCSETYDPEQTGGSCPSCQTPHPGVQQVTGGDDSSDESSSGDSESNGGSTADDQSTAPQQPSVECPNPDCAGTIEAGAEFCIDCGAERGEEFDTPSSSGGGASTCPNGHEVDADAKFCSECGAEIGSSSTGGTGPSVTLEIGGESFTVVDDGSITVNDDEKSADKFGTDARTAARNNGVDADTARQIHRDYLSFRVDGEQVYVTNHGRNPTKYNGSTFDQGDERALTDGDTIDLGAGAATATVRLTN